MNATLRVGSFESVPSSVAPPGHRRNTMARARKERIALPSSLSSAPCPPLLASSLAFRAILRLSSSFPFPPDWTIFSSPSSLLTCCGFDLVLGGLFSRAWRVLVPSPLWTNMLKPVLLWFASFWKHAIHSHVTDNFSDGLIWDTNVSPQIDNAVKMHMCRMIHWLLDLLFQRET